MLLAACSVLSICGSVAVGGGRPGNQPPKTPLAAYQKEVTNRIGRLWYASIQKEKESLVTGTVTMNFRIEPNGRVTNLKVTSNTSSESFAKICLAAVMEAQFPAIPDAVKRELHHEFLDWDDIKFTLYPN